jgi:hypothetical protein
VNSLLSILGRPEPEQNKLRNRSSLASGPTVDSIAYAQHHGPDEQNVQRSERAQPAQPVIAGLRGSPNAFQVSEDLSPREIELLWTTAKDAGGGIQHSRTLDGESIITNGRHFLKDADARTVAAWLGALRSLEDRSFVETLSNERSFFKLTDKGYEAANLVILGSC